MFEITSNTTSINAYFSFEFSKKISKIQEIALRFFKQISDIFFMSYCCFKEAIQVIPIVGFKDNNSKIAKNLRGQGEGDIRACAEQLFNPNMPGHQDVAIIKAVAKTSQEERKEQEVVIPQAKAKNLRGQGKGDIRAYAEQLFTSDMSDHQKVLIIEAVAKIPKDKQEVVIPHARAFVNYGMGRRYNLYHLIHIIKVAEEKDVFTYAVEFLQVWDKRLAFSIANIPVEERIDVIELASHRPITDIFGRINVDVVKAIGEIPSDERQLVVDIGKSLINLSYEPSYMENEYKAKIISAIANIPPENRDTFIDDLRKFGRIDYGCSFNKNKALVTFIESLAAIRNTMDCILPLTENRSMGSINERIRLFQAVAEIPQDDRENVINHARQLITPQMFVSDIILQIENVAATPREERAAFVEGRRRGQVRVQQAQRGGIQQAQRQGINVHENKRDERVKDAFLRLKEVQKNVSKEEIQEASSAFITYLGALEDSEKKHSALFSLLSPKNDGEDFGPLIDGVYFSINGLGLTGEEVVGRLWIFASKLEEKEQENAKASMVSALVKSNEGYGRVCNGGKTQRLAVGVLQGRLEGVQIDSDQITTADVVREFFAVEAHKGIENFTELLQAATDFLQERPMVNQTEFLKEVKEIANLNGIVIEA